MIETAYLGAGCFWHAELTFSKIDGVSDTEVGFSEIRTSNNKKSKVEVVKISYDTAKIAFSDLINIFWTTHDPSSENNLNENYVEKSVIFTTNQDQENQALESLEQKKADNNPKSVYTEVREHSAYKKGPNKDQKYYFKN